MSHLCTPEAARAANSKPTGQLRSSHEPVRKWRKLAAFGMTSAAAVLVSACGSSGSMQDNSAADAAAANAALVAQGQQIFRFDTFGDETKWTDALRMHEVIAAAVDPKTALSVGLKVDAEALPRAVVSGIQNGTISLTSPATTIALLKLNAVVGVRGTVTSVN